MKTSDTFTYTSKYATYTECHFETNRYRSNNNLYLSIVDEDDVVAVCSVNADRVNGEFEIGIKNYSENEGMVAFLQHMDIIEKYPVASESSGFVLIPYFKLTENGKELFM